MTPRYILFSIANSARARVEGLIKGVEHLVTGTLEDVYELVVLNTVELTFKMLSALINRVFDLVDDLLIVLMGPPEWCSERDKDEENVGLGLTYDERDANA